MGGQILSRAGKPRFSHMARSAGGKFLALFPKKFCCSLEEIGVSLKGGTNSVPGLKSGGQILSRNFGQNFSQSNSSRAEFSPPPVCYEENPGKIKVGLGALQAGQRMDLVNRRVEQDRKKMVIQKAHQGNLFSCNIYD